MPGDRDEDDDEMDEGGMRPGMRDPGMRDPGMRDDEDDEPGMRDMREEDDEMDMDMDMGDEPEMDMGDEKEMMEAEHDMDEDLMEALAGINYVPSQTEVVNEVAKRVARRLKAAKLHEAKLNRALGRK